MARTVNHVMTHDPRTVAPGDTLADATKQMRDGDIGAVIVAREGSAAGILTDRDIVVRAIAAGRDPSSTTVGDVASSTTVTVTPDTSVEEAARLMKEHDIRRLVVVQDGRPAGIISLGDLSLETETDSVLEDISTASPNN